MPLSLWTAARRRHVQLLDNRKKVTQRCHMVPGSLFETDLLYWTERQRQEKSSPPVACLLQWWAGIMQASHKFSLPYPGYLLVQQEVDKDFICLWFVSLSSLSSLRTFQLSFTCEVLIFSGFRTYNFSCAWTSFASGRTNRMDMCTWRACYGMWQLTLQGMTAVFPLSGIQLVLLFLTSAPESRITD